MFCCQCSSSILKTYCPHRKRVAMLSQMKWHFQHSALCRCHVWQCLSQMFSLPVFVRGVSAEEEKSEPFPEPDVGPGAVNHPTTGFRLQTSEPRREVGPCFSVTWVLRLLRRDDSVCIVLCALSCYRLELEQLQSLRSAVREELQELEQQLEDRLVELTHQTRYGVYTELQTCYKHVHIQICKVYTVTYTAQDRWTLQ